MVFSSPEEESTSAYVRLLAFRVDFRVDMVVAGKHAQVGQYIQTKQSGDGDKVTLVIDH